MLIVGCARTVTDKSELDFFKNYLNSAGIRYDVRIADPKIRELMKKQEEVVQPKERKRNASKKSTLDSMFD